MKTLTEFSPLLLRNAAAARDAVGEPPTRVAPPAATETVAADAPADDAGSEAVDAGGEATEAAADSPAEAPAEAPAETDPAVSALAAALNVQPDRAQRLLEALDIIGDRIDEVRLVRVFQGENGPPGSVSRGEF